MASQASSPVYNLTSFVGGISDFTDKGIAGSGQWSSGLNIRSGDDALVCQQALVQESEGVFEDLILWFVPAPDGNCYGFGDQGRIYKRDSGGNWSKVYTEPEGKIRGAALSYRYVSTNTYQPFLFWATETSLHRKQIPGQTNWSDVDAAGTGTGETYPKTNLMSADWHYMRVVDQCLLIANNNRLAAVFIEDGSYTNEAEGNPFPPSITITTLTNCARGNSSTAALCSAANIVEQACLYDISTASPASVSDIDWLSRTNLSFSKVDACIDGEFFLIFAEGKIWYSDLYNKQPICALPSGATVKPGGTTIRDNVALFAVSNAVRTHGDTQITANGIYGYGRNKNAGTPVLNLEYPMITDELGGLVNFHDTNTGKQVLLVASRVGNQYRVYTISETTKQVGEFTSLILKAPYSEFPSRFRVTNVIVKSGAIPQGAKVEVFYRLDLQGDFKQAYFSQTMDKQNSDCEFTSGTEATWEIGDNASYIELAVKITPVGNSSPQVKDIFIVLEPEAN